MIDTTCRACNGTGWGSCARDSGTEKAHPMHMQFGTYPCRVCGGRKLTDGPSEMSKQISEMAANMVKNKKEA